MTEREKLIELIGQYTENITARELHEAEFDEKFTDYLLDNGVIVPPCKVGAKVWHIGADECVTEFKMLAVIICKGIKKVMLGVDKFDGELIDSYFEEFGKTVFLAPEEAEKALEERGK